jgi:hypothetical protein
MFEIFAACGRQALPLPLAHTLMLRAALGQAGVAAPRGALAIASASRITPDGEVVCQGVPFGRVAEWVLAFAPDQAWLLPLAAAERRDSGVHGSLQAHLRWPRRPEAALPLPAPVSWRHVGAVLGAAMMAGALNKVLEMTLVYANQRAQFGKSIGKFQAVQQQLSVLAEQVFAARMAAQIGCVSPNPWPLPLRAAAAKARAGEAAERVVAIAHAVHGAIGITAEYDLQLLTRRLQEWRIDFGAAPYWHAQLGRALLAAPAGTVLDFLLAELAPAASP